MQIAALRHELLTAPMRSRGAGFTVLEAKNSISYFANICKFYARMRNCSKQASRLATKLPVCVQYNVVKQNK